MAEAHPLAQSASTAPATTRVEPPGSARWGWARQPEFWLAVALAAFLRLWHVDFSQFLDDQAGLMRLARESVLRGALPLTGIRSSIGTLNPPLSVYILQPFALFTADPLPQVIALALWNVLGIALCYIFALRYFGRRAAAIAALLFATCGAAVDYSRFIWQQNYLPPLLMLWAFTLYHGAVRGRRPWLAANLALLVVIASLHPTGLALAGVTLVALLITPALPSWRDTLVAVAVVALLLAPTLLWELLSTFSDIAAYQTFSTATPVFNFDIFLAFSQMLGAPAAPSPASNLPFAVVHPDTLYARLGRMNWALAHATSLLYLATYAGLTFLAFAGARRIRARAGESGNVIGRVRRWVRALRARLQADARWRAYLLLWFWLTLPPLVMLRHNKTVQAHYLFVVYPAVFLATGLVVDRAIVASRKLPALLARWSAGALRDRTPAVVRGALVTLIALIVVGQALQTALYLAALGGNQTDNSRYGYPLSQLRDADTILARLQRDQRASGILLSAPDRGERSALDYMLVRERPDRVTIGGDCLVLPAPRSTTLVVSTVSASPGARLLATLPNARRVSKVEMPGGEPFVVYSIGGAAPLLAGESALPALEYHTPTGDVLRLVALARTAPGVLRLRWQVVATAPASAPASEYQVRAYTRNGAIVARASCTATRWQPGETVFTWLSTAWTIYGTNPNANAQALPVGPLGVELARGTSVLWQRRLGPLPVISAAPAGDALTVVPSDRGARYQVNVSG